MSSEPVLFTNTTFFCEVLYLPDFPFLTLRLCDLFATREGMYTGSTVKPPHAHGLRSPLQMVIPSARPTR